MISNGRHLLAREFEENRRCNGHIKMVIMESSVWILVIDLHQIPPQIDHC